MALTRLVGSEESALTLRPMVHFTLGAFQVGESVPTSLTDSTERSDSVKELAARWELLARPTQDQITPPIRIMPVSAVTLPQHATPPEPHASRMLVRSAALTTFFVECCKYLILLDLPGRPWRNRTSDPLIKSRLVGP